MKIRMLTLFLLAALLLTACGADDPGVLTPEEAQKIVLEDTGLSAKDVSDIHTHITEHDGIPGYSIHITIDGAEYEYIIDGVTGDILHADDIP